MNDNLTLTISYRTEKCALLPTPPVPPLPVSHCSEQAVDLQPREINAYNRLFLPELFVRRENINIYIRSVSVLHTRLSVTRN